MRDRLSPNADDRPPGRAPDMLILHYTGMESAAAALDRLCDPKAAVSAHYLIEEDGTLWRLVAEERRAWHAGVAEWEGAQDINARSIGIELVNPGHEFGYRPFPEPQISRLIELARDIVRRHRIPPSRVLGHSDVAPTRKCDPGELFPWPRLARAGLALWPSPSIAVDDLPCMAELRDMLRKVGYAVDTGGEEGETTRAVITAFQRHWRPSGINGVADRETVTILRGVLAAKEQEG